MPRLLPGRLPRRFRLGTFLALPAIVALGLGWAGLGPRRKDPYWSSLEWEMSWARDDTHRFLMPAARRAPCLLKVVHLYDTSSLGDYLDQRFAVDGAGELKAEIRTEFGARGTSRALPAGAVPAIRSALASLPPSSEDIGPGDAIVVGFRGPRGWEVRVYDESRLPPPVATLFDAAGIAPP